MSEIESFSEMVVLFHNVMTHDLRGQILADGQTNISKFKSRYQTDASDIGFQVDGTYVLLRTQHVCFVRVPRILRLRMPCCRTRK